ncbi:Vacuolar protein sorting-associated protein 9a [Colletotrichum orbiculare MAFF 240422]|uniref:Vacuolar protein sorting-associated protein 9a n=1 Tax=Colletotrichum orbiculare (strain 104-T / ATCC 96160 / CBS 514.97 / LARS 414 / MAFF 240422) TaxID=1213857 RepID=N4VPA5_COLOR|nr:Vacuolar protein sorting-associated protein 9a [Colletotrichum orbiculare MAFF 240422]
MSSTDPTDHSSGLSGNAQNGKPTAPVTSAAPAGSKPETKLASLDNNVQHDKPVLSERAAGKQQASDDLIDFGIESPALNPAVDASTADEVNAKTHQSAGQPAPLSALDSTSEPLSSSMATLKPTSPLPAETVTQYLTIESTSAPYVDPTPSTPRTSQPPSRTPSNATSRHRSTEASPTRSDAAYDERRYGSEDEQETGSRSEIQSIMEQFTGDGGGPGAEEVMSPRLELTSPMLGSPGLSHPPRNSSLEPLAPSLSHQVQDLQGLRIQTASPASMFSREKSTDDHGPPVPPKDGPPVTPAKSHEDRQMSVDSQMSPGLHRPPPPEPEPEPTLPFDFHRFLEQLRNKKADPVARYLKSFLSEFGKRQWMVHEQVKIISDFLAFIANKMAQCEVWRDVSDAEFDNAREGMEKLVMNRLYTQTFSPAISPPQPIPGAKPKRRGGERPMGPGRRGQHQEDVERDDVLTQKINIYGWIREEHLDIPPAGESGRRFLKLAQQELLKIKSYRAPRDKIICVLNCCKVIFGLLKHSKSDSSADSFMPLLIYVVLQANPEHLVSNVQYILRFRNQEKLGGEAGYYLSSLMGVIQFIENMDRTTLTITDDEFEKNVEAAVSAIAEKHRLDSPHPVQEPTFSEKSGLPYQSNETSARPSLDMAGGGESSIPRRSTSSIEVGTDSDQAPISGLLRSIQKPLSTIGRMFSDDSPSGPSSSSRAQPASERFSPRPSVEVPPDGARPVSHQQLSAEEAAARQASAETAEAQRLHRAEHNNVVETLSGMFPDLDRDIISDVVYQKQGRVGLAVDACLALST